MAPKCGENCPISGRRKIRKSLSRLWLSWFFGPEYLGGRFGYFLFFFCSGEGESGGNREGGGVRFLLKIPGGGGVVFQEGRGGEGAGRVFAGNWRGGGAKYFFSGPKCPPRYGIAIPYGAIRGYSAGATTITCQPAALINFDLFDLCVRPGLAYVSDARPHVSGEDWGCAFLRGRSECHFKRGF